MLWTLCHGALRGFFSLLKALTHHCMFYENVRLLPRRPKYWCIRIYKAILGLLRLLPIDLYQTEEYRTLQPSVTGSFLAICPKSQS